MQGNSSLCQETTHFFARPSVVIRKEVAPQSRPRPPPFCPRRQRVGAVRGYNEVRVFKTPTPLTFLFQSVISSRKAGWLLSAALSHPPRLRKKRGVRRKEEKRSCKKEEEEEEWEEEEGKKVSRENVNKGDKSLSL